MPGSTTNGLPYPLGTDRLMDGDDAIKALAQALDPAWTPVAFRAGYITKPSNYACAWRLVAGVLYFKGQFQKGTGNFTGSEVFADLPAGARPAFTVSMAAASALATGVTARIDINSAGALTIVTGSGWTPAWVGLDGIAVWIGAGT